MSSAADPRAVRFIFATMLLNAIGFGIIIPVVPALVMELGHSDIGSAAAIGGWLAFTFAITQFFSSPIVGNLSDRFGRRPVLLGSLAGYAVDFLVLALAPSLLWIFIARALSGAFGATQGPAQAAIADLAGPEERARLFGFLGAAFGIGFVVGPAIGGVLGEFDPRLPFWAAGGLTVANLLYGWFAMPETLAKANRRPFDWRRANPIGAFAQLRRIPGIAPLALVYFLWQFATLVWPMVWSYFLIARFDWSEGLIGASLALTGIVMATTQMVVAPRLVKRLGERRTATLGMAGTIVSMLLTALAPAGWMIFAMAPLFGFQSLVHPTLTALIANHGSARNQGEVQGLGSAVMAVGSVLAPLVYNPLLAWFTRPEAPVRLEGAPILLAASVALLTLLLFLRCEAGEAEAETEAGDPASAD